MSLFVGNLTRNAKQQDLETTFGRYGECRVQMKEGYAFVVYAVVRDAETALNTLCGKPLGDEFPRITWSKRQPLPRDPATGPAMGGEGAPRWIHNKDQAPPYQQRTGEWKGVDNGSGPTGLWPPQVHAGNGKMEGPMDLIGAERSQQLCSHYPDPTRSSVAQLKAAFFSSGPVVAQRQESFTDRVRRDVPESRQTGVFPRSQSDGPSGRCDQKLPSPPGVTVMKNGHSHSKNGVISGYVNSNGGDTDRFRGPGVESCRSTWPSRDPLWNAKVSRDVSEQREPFGNREPISDDWKDPAVWKEQEKGEHNRTSNGSSMPHASSVPAKDDRHLSKGKSKGSTKQAEKLDTDVSDGSPVKSTKRSYVDTGAVHHSESCMEYPVGGSRGRVTKYGRAKGSPVSFPRKSSSRSSHSRPDRTSGSGSRSAAQECSPRSRQSSSSSFSESKSLSRSPAPCSHKSLAASPSHETRSRSYSPASISLARSESQRSTSPPKRHASAAGAVNRHRPAEMVSKYVSRSVSQSPQAKGQTRIVCRFSGGKSEKGRRAGHVKGVDRQEISASNTKRRDLCPSAPGSGPRPIGKDCTNVAGQTSPTVSGKRARRELVGDNLGVACKFETGEYHAVKRLKVNGRSAELECEMEDTDHHRTYGSERRSRSNPRAAEGDQTYRVQMVKDNEEGSASDEQILNNSRTEQGRTGISPKPDRVAEEVNECSGHDQRSDQESGEISREPVVERTEVASSEENHKTIRRASRRESRKVDLHIREPEGTLYGAARFWPWEVILARRCRRGPVSMENFERRRAQNAAHSIVDKYVRSSTGWWERDSKGRLLE